MKTTTMTVLFSLAWVYLVNFCTAVPINKANENTGPEETRMCSFEDSLAKCGYTHINSDFEWTTTNNALGRNDGRYLSLSAAGRRAGETARVRSMSLNPRDVYRVSFRYFIHSPSMRGAGELLIHSLDASNNVRTVWSRTAHTNGLWSHSQVWLPAGVTAVLLEGIKGESADANIALDSINIICRRCAYENPVENDPTTKPPVATTKGSTRIIHQCDFDTDMCGYTQSHSDSFDWTRKKGRTSSDGTGPMADHTSGQGYYVYTETSNPRQRGDIAVITSPVLRSGVDLRLSFWYHMQGQHIGRLSVRAVLDDGESRTMSLWSKTGHQQTEWAFSGEISLPGNIMRVQFESTVGGGYQGDVSIDDVIITSGIEEKSTTPTASHTTASPGGTGSLPMSCDFESGLCGFQRSTSANMNWERVDMPTASIGTGPSRDHTRGGHSVSGYFVYIEASMKRKGVEAKLTYRLQEATTSSFCVRFWYHMYGHHIGSLRLQSGNTLLTEIKGDIDKNRGDRSWHEAQTTLPIGSTEFTFVGVRGDGHQGDIGLDDIQVTKGPC